jgi:hypothetical protein
MNVIKNIVRRKELQSNWKVDYDGTLYRKSKVVDYDRSKKVLLTDYSDVIRIMMDFASKKFTAVDYSDVTEGFWIEKSTIDYMYSSFLSRLQFSLDEYYAYLDGLREISFQNMDIEYRREVVLENAVHLYIHTQFFMPYFIYGYDRNVFYCRIHNEYSVYRFRKIWEQTELELYAFEKENTGVTIKEYLSDMIDKIKLSPLRDLIYKQPDTLMKLIRDVLHCVIAICISLKFTYCDLLATYLILISDYDLSDEKHDEVSDESAVELLKTMNSPDVDYTDLLNTRYVLDCTENSFDIYKACLGSVAEEDKESDKKEDSQEKSISSICYDHDSVYHYLSNFNQFSEEDKEELVGAIVDAFNFVLEKCHKV